MRKCIFFSWVIAILLMVGAGCSMVGAGCSDDSETKQQCGDGVVSEGETCDSAIAADQEGACPTSCDDGRLCTTDTLIGSAAICTAACIHSDDACFTGTVYDFYNKIIVPGAVVHVLDNATGAAFAPDIWQTADAYGKVAFDNLPNVAKVGFKVDGINRANPYITTYKFNLSTTAKAAKIWLFDKSNFDLSVNYAGTNTRVMVGSDIVSQYTISQFQNDLQVGGTGVIGGRVYWIDPNDTKVTPTELPVGCATVTISVGGTPHNDWIVYSDQNSMPVPYGTGVCTADPNVTCRTSTDRIAGDFSSIHVPPGTAHLTATININGTDEIVGEEDVIVLPLEGGGTTWTYYSFEVSNIYVDSTKYTSNPTPTDCQ